jgi:hypothetical protein
MHEQRLSTRMVTMWDKLAELTPPPMFAQFNKNAISDIWQQCAVLKIEPKGAQSDIYEMTIDFLGDLAKKLLPDYRAGQRITTKTMNLQAKKYFADIGQVITNCETLVNSGAVIGTNSKMVKYRVCLLPFKDKNDTVTYIVVGFSWIEC